MTGERQLALISESQEIEMGRQAAQQVERSIGLVEDQALQNYLQQIGARLAADSERAELPWTFRAVDDPTPNAFALPGGFIFVTRGMLSYMDSEAELAAVLGHEIGHVTARHGVQLLSRAQLAQLGLGFGMIFLPELQQFGGLFSSGLELLFLKYGRDAERQADKLGFAYALEQLYDVREMDDIFATLQTIASQEGRSPLPAWASTHPDPGERIETVQQRLASLKPGLFGKLHLDRADFLSQIDELVWGENPRNGFFVNNVFAHPQLAFRISFPEGWRTQNLPQAIVGVSPERDAALQLTLAPGDPASAARSFLGQQGVQAGPAAQEIINGSPAILARFAGQTQQGLLQGLAGFVEHRGKTYQIVGFAPAARYPALEDSFAQTVRSFAIVTDPEVLNVRPRRIDIVKLPRPMSMAELAQQEDPAGQLETLLLINQVTDPSHALPAGTLVKRIVRERGR